MSAKNIEDIYSLTPTQQGMLFHCLEGADEGVYFVQLTFAIQGPLDVTAFERAWQRVVERHPILRTAFVWENLEKPLQGVARQVVLPLERLDWRGLSPDEQQEQLQAYLKVERKHGFNLARAPLMRLALMRLADERYQVAWNHHHLLLDGWSVPLVVEEVFAFYKAFSKGRELTPEPRRPFRDYIAWLQRQDLARAEAFWREILKGFSAPTPLVIDGLGINVADDNSGFKEQSITLSTETTAALQALVRQHRLTLNTLVQGAWALLLNRYGGEQDIIFGVTVSGRPTELIGVERMLGMFINTLPLRVQVTPDTQVLTWLKLMQERHVDMRQFEYSPLAQIQKWSDIAPGMPLFESILVFENYPIAAFSLDESNSLRIADISSVEQTNYPITIMVVPETALVLQIAYDSQRFAAAFIARLLGHLQTLLEGIQNNPARRLGDLSLLTAAERQQIVVDWNATAVPYPQDRCLHQLFEAQATHTPTAPAVRFADSELTYQALNERANQLAHALVQRGVGPDTMVGVAMERSLEMVVALYAILKAGGAYVPLDPSYPPDRLSFMLGDAQVAVLLTQKSIYDLRFTIYDLSASDEQLLELKTQTPRGHPELKTPVVLCLDADWDALVAAMPTTNPTSPVRPDHLAYMIYTSGSTGTPKGAMNSHRGIVNRLLWMQDAYRLDASDCVLQKTPFSFDVSVWEFFWPLMVGARLVVAQPGGHQDSAYLARLIAEQAVTTLHFVPSMLQVFVEEPSLAACTSLRRVICSGEALPFALQQRFFARCDAELHNLYGPTEAAVDVSYWVCERDSVEAVVPIGRPIANIQFYILDRTLRPVPIGVAGELHIGGIGLARGYWRRPELTAERFIPNPFGGVLGDGCWVTGAASSNTQHPTPNTRLYKTGDLARYRADGSIEYLGRLDFQVKLRGLRIELGEIETALARHAAVRETVVLAREGAAGGMQLVAYLVTSDTSLVTRHSSLVTELRDFLKDKLPDYMVPAAFVVLDALPLSPNGKVDRRALPAPEPLRSDQETAFELPRMPTEQLLADIWAQTLGLARVGIHDNFFELGGDSILSLQIIGRANRAGVRLTPRQIFQAPTIARLAVLADTTPAIQAEQGVVTGPLPLTPIQHWFFAQQQPEPHHFNLSMPLIVPSQLELGRLTQAMQALLAHHDALRLRFTQTDGRWQQHIATPDDQFAIIRIDLAQTPDDDLSAAIEREASAIQASLDLTNGPLLRAAYFDLGAARPGRLLLALHHLAVDGVSWRVLLEDLQTAYQQLRQGAPIQLPPKTTSFKAWAARLEQYVQSSALDAERLYWLDAQRGQIAPLPIDFPAARTANTIASTQTVTVALSMEETQALLQEVPAAYNTQINDVLLTALAQAFAGWSGSRALLVDLEGHGRAELFPDIDLSRTVGWFTSIFPVRLDLGDGGDPGTHMRSIKEQLRGIPNDGVGYGLLRYLQHDDGATALDELPQAEVLFNYLGQLDQALLAGELFVLAGEAIGADTSPHARRRHALEVNGAVSAGRLTISWTYSTRLHRQETIERLAASFVAALQGLIAHCLSPQAGGYTPSDFALLRLTQAQLDQIAAAIGSATGRQAKDRIEDIYPLTALQQGMLFHNLYEPGSGVYYEQMVADLAGELDPVALGRAWQTVVARHPILRTAFLWEQLDTPVQVVLRNVPLPFDVLDWRDLSDEEQAARLDAQLQADRRRGFELDHAPIMRLSIIRMTDTSHKLLWSHHHILLDGWSLPLLYQEIFDAYEAFRRGGTRRWEARRPYRDYVAWLQQQDLVEAEQFWRRTLADFTTPTPLGIDRASSGGAEHDSATQEIQLAGPATAALHQFVRQHQLTLNTLLQGAWALLLSCYSGEQDVMFGVTLSGRPAILTGVESMIGLFINTLPARVRVVSEQPLLDWLHTLQDQQAELRRYEYSPLAQVQAWSDVPAGAPLFESILVFENYPVDAALRGQVGSLSIEDAQAIEMTNYPLTLIGIPGRELTLRISYMTDRFDSAMIGRMLQHFQIMLERMAADPAQRLGSLSPLTEAERQQLLVEWNRTPAAPPFTATIHELFAAQAAATPSALAVVAPDAQLSYQQLDTRANQLAHVLRAHGVGPDTLVAVCLERCCDLIVALLAVLKAGGAYVPLDPSLPTERLAFLLLDTQAPVLLTQTSIYDLRFTFYDFSASDDQPPELKPQNSKLKTRLVLCLDRDWPAIARSGDTNPATPTSISNLAYVIYTSGSTGTPKGVAVSHANLANLVAWHQRAYAISAADRATQVAGLGFDAAVWEIWPYLLAGACLHLPDEATRAELPRLLAWLGEQRITVSFLPTPLAEAALALEWPRESALRLLLTGGDLLHRGPRAGTSFALVNNYGPTENTVVATWTFVPPDTLGAPPIGRPVDQVQLYVLDRTMRPVPVGVVGELYLGGESLARGYWRRADLTAERFVPNPFGGVLGDGCWVLEDKAPNTQHPSPNTRLYKTGDAVRYRADGQLEYVGRADQQVKVRGFRIELGEIEAVLRLHEAVREAVVVARAGANGGKQLVAYVVPSRGAEVRGQGAGRHGDTETRRHGDKEQGASDSQSPIPNPQSPIPALRDFLTARLPEYMVPSAFVLLDALPLTPNGKVDRRALPAPEQVRSEQDGDATQPRTSVEQILADIWRAVLGRDRIRLHDNFFEFGGDSILSIQIVARAAQAGLRLTPRQLFQHPTIAALAEVVDTTTTVAAEQGVVVGTLPLTPIQRWFFAQQSPQPQHYNQAVLLTVPAGLDLGRLEQVVRALLVHHDALRLRFCATDGTWRQVNAAPDDQTIVTRVDFAPVPDGDLAAEIEQASSAVQASLDLADGPLVRIIYFDLGAARPGRLLIVIHHLAVDGVSWRVLLEDLQSAYQQLNRGEALQLPPKTTSFKQWAERLEHYAQSDALAGERDFWLAEPPAQSAPLPTDFPVTPDASLAGAMQTVVVSLGIDETRALLQEVPAAYNTQINDMLLAALAQVLNGWIGRPGVLIDLEGHGREELFADVDLARTVGWFTAMFPVLLDLDAASQPADVLRSVKEQLRRTPNNGIGYGLLCYLGADAELNARFAALPQAEVLFNYLGQLDQALPGDGLIGMAQESSGMPHSPHGKFSHRLIINGQVFGGQLELAWTYSERLYRRETVEGLAQACTAALRALIAHCLTPEAGGFTPSDFPLAILSQQQIDRVVGLIGRSSGRAVKARIEDIYALTPMQQGMFFHSLQAPGEGMYLTQVTCTLQGDFDAGTFERAWQQVIDRHPILRTAFLWEELDAPVQMVCHDVRVPWDQQDWRDLQADERAVRLAAYLEADALCDFDFARAPLMRLTLIRLDDTTYELIWSYHHLLLDGWSVPLVLNEAFELYAGARRGQVPHLEARRPYRDYIAWLQRQDLAAAEAYWRQVLGGFSAPTPLAVDRPTDMPVEAASRYGERALLMPAETTVALQMLVQQQQLTLSTLVQGAWALLLSRYSGEGEVLFGAAVAGRPAMLPGVEGMLGLFINTLPVRVRTSAGLALASWLHDLQAQQAELRQYEYSPLAQVQKWSDVPGGTPLFESIVVFENYPIDSALGGQVESLGVIASKTIEHGNYPLTLLAIPGQQLRLQLNYDARRFDTMTIARMLGHLHTLLDGMVSDPTRRLGDLPLLTAHEHEQLIAWNATAMPYPQDRCLHEHFLAQVARTPNAIAVVFDGPGARGQGDKETRRQGDKETGDAAPNTQHLTPNTQCLTYSELCARASQLAHALQMRGVGPDTPVGVAMERSLDLVVALYAVLLAGGAYVPLDPAYPKERLSFMLADAQVAVLLTQKSIYDLRFTIDDFPAELKTQNSELKTPVVLCLDADWDALVASLPTTPPASAVKPEHLAYMIYTSGSTGTPKGAMNSHRGIVNRLLWMQDAYQLDPTDRVLQKTPFSFDVSVWEFFWPLLVGARLVVAVPGGHQDSAYLARLIEEQAVTTLHFVPSMLQVFVEEPTLAHCASPRRVICSGEALPYALQQRFFARCEAELHNLYGPTEAAVDVSSWACARESAEAVVPIGRPIANIQLYILDRAMRPVPIGVAGELHIGGVGLARGYWRRPALTAERFVPNPFGGVLGDGCWVTGAASSNTQHPTPNTRLYRTGDLARYRADGSIEYLGRLDFQVKLRGLRIELGEIEAALARHPTVRETVVLAREDRPGVKRLVAYIVPTAEDRGLKIEDSMPSTAETLSSILYPLSSDLRTFLRERLPDYMIPAAFVVLDALPLSPNGKVDRRALPAPEQERPEQDETFVSPQTSVEQILADIWARTLGVARVGIHDNFFALGGDSILSLQIIARANQAGVRLIPRQIFQAPTIAQLALLATTTPALMAEQGIVTGPVPLMPIQRWFFDQQLLVPQHFNQSILLATPAGLELDWLTEAAQALLAHHDALRMRFAYADGHWQQHMAAADDRVAISRMDLAGIPAAERAAAITREANATQASLNLIEGPLLRMVYFDQGPGQPGWLFIVIHHMAVDGVSWRVLLEDLQTAYHQFGAGAPIQLPPKTTSFKTWATRLERYAQSSTLDAERPYWMDARRRQIAPLPTDFSVARTANTVTSAQTVTVQLSAEETQALLQEVPQAYNTQINDVLLTALAQVLAAWMGTASVLLSLEGHGREDLFDDIDVSRTVGWFTSRFPVLLELGEETQPGTLLPAIKEQVRRIPNRGIGYGLLRYLRRDAGASALAALPQPDVEFNYLGQLDQTLSNEELLFQLATETTGPDVGPDNLLSHLLIINGQVVGGQLAVSWTFSTYLYHQQTIAELAEHFLAALRTLIAHCLSPEAGGSTPSDFPLAQIDTQTLDDLMEFVEFEE